MQLQPRAGPPAPLPLMLGVATKPVVEPNLWPFLQTTGRRDWSGWAGDQMVVSSHSEVCSPCQVIKRVSDRRQAPSYWETRGEPAPLKCQVTVHLPPRLDNPGVGMGQTAANRRFDPCSSLCRQSNYCTQYAAAYAPPLPGSENIRSPLRIKNLDAEDASLKAMYSAAQGRISGYA